VTNVPIPTPARSAPAVFWSVISRVPTGLGPNPIDDPLIPPFQGDPNTVTPGVAGFFAIFFVAVASIFVIVDMARRIRRVRYRGEVRERLEAERLEAERLAAGHSAVETALSEPAGEADGSAGVEGRVDRDE
jgi:hypothetical protein